MKIAKYIMPVARVLTSLGVIGAAVYRQIIGEGNAFIAAVIPSATVTMIGGVEDICNKYNEPPAGTVPLKSVRVENPPAHFQNMVINSRNGERQCKK